MAEDKMLPHLRPIPHDGHEERILRSESEISELKASHAELSANVKNLGEQVHTLGVNLGLKIDGFASHLVEKVQDEHQRVTSLKERVSENAASLAKIEDEKKRQAEKWDNWKKFFATAMTGAIAIGLKELVVWITRHA